MTIDEQYAEFRAVLENLSALLDDTPPDVGGMAVIVQEALQLDNERIAAQTASEPSKGFQAYFNIADEIWPKGDINEFDFQPALMYAMSSGFPWPPDLPFAEEKLNDFRCKRITSL